MESSDCTSDSDASSSKKPFRCTEKGCNVSFSRKSKLAHHILKHTGERPFACDEAGCSKTYTNSYHLRRHKKASHDEKPSQSILCEHEGCGLVFATKYSLKRHCNLKHNPQNYPFICGDCSQGFHRKRQLQQHVYLHTGQAPFECDQCEMGFTTNRNLSRHKRIHRKHTCDCGEVFDRWSDILLHKRSCKKPRYKCEICEKSFSHLGNYQDHQVTHKKKTERMVYVCPYPDCKRFYFQKRNIKYHIDNFHKRINENKSYGCTYPRCPAKLKTKQSLKMHLQRHFKWVQKKQRRARHDKGKPKKSILSVVIGQEKPKENSELGITPEDHPENLQVSLTEDVTDEVLLRQCDLTLSALNEEIAAAT